MAMSCQIRRMARGSRGTPVMLLLVAALSAAAVLMRSFPAGFVSGLSGSRVSAQDDYTQALRASRRNPSLFAEGPSSGQESSAGALVKIDEDNLRATAGILAGLAGLLVGGFWIGAATFAASSYFAKKDDDVGTALKSVSKSALEALNFTAGLDGKYKVTEQVGQQVGSTIDKNVKGENKAVVQNISDTVGNVDGNEIKTTLGSFALSATDLAASAVERIVEFNDKNKVTDKVADAASDLAKKAQDAQKK